MPTFTPPTVPESMPGDPLWSRVSVQVGQSVVKKNGHYKTEPYPWLGDIKDLVEGVDWFGGGRTYVVSAQVATDLQNDGFTTGP